MNQTSPELSSGWRSPLFIRAAALAAATLWRWHGDREGQRPALGRLTSHAALILTFAVFIVIGSLQTDSLASVMKIADKNLLEGFAQSVDAASPAALTAERPYYRIASQARIVRQAQLHTAIPDRPRLEVITYTVQVGDTPEKIAEMFDLQPTTLLWSNPEMEKMPDLLQVGQTLTILPVDGVYHTVGVSDTVESLAEAYNVDVDAILNCPYNEVPADTSVAVGDKLIVPGGSKPFETRKVTSYTGDVPKETNALGLFGWPSTGALTQGYWYGHRAIDIGAPIGTAIKASDGGFVSFVGWTDIGYGYLIVVDHQNGYQTYYAHLSDIFISEGQVVDSGEVIGAMGSTGNSTGPHLHFEIRYNGYPTNPLIYLR